MGRHVRTISPARPAEAQLDGLIQLAGLINAIIGIFQNLLRFAEDVIDFLGNDA